MMISKKAGSIIGSIAAGIALTAAGYAYYKRRKAACENENMAEAPHKHSHIRKSHREQPTA